MTMKRSREFEQFLKEINRLHHDYATEQVLHDSRQVTSLSQLTFGQQFAEMRDEYGKNKPTGLVFTVLGISPKSGFVRVKMPDDQEKDLSLADRGIVPYIENTWNDIYFLLPAKAAAKPLPIDPNKIHPKALYIEVELIDGANDDMTFGHYYYGPFHNLDKAETMKPLIGHHHRLKCDSCYTRVYISEGRHIYVKSNEIVSPKDFLKEFSIKGFRELQILDEKLKEARTMFPE
jgi:hypothetical protein